MQWRKKREKPSSLGGQEGLSHALAGLRGGRAPEHEVWVRRALGAGEGACLCKLQGPALEPLKSHVLAEVYILGKIMRVGH